VRNTSTGVEKTVLSSKDNAFGWKHLHGRGEDFVVGLGVLLQKETPPRAWRRLQ